ncbi:flagellar hook-basal body complex protein FliE [Dyella terrae]|jgi:flagellar hook-basal body complex protein FliE|uniref:flagellar hook-basal body complex protein FliE n=1 Tax=Dyella terrae TaxID=522259 RepID=UPI001EFDE1A0|nr:flagellar hook-basal body complex protein FliE [Dyella terrae]ULU23709.1 flagellar hook-basal body complex protein FliE [Dyella terrae]
MSIAAIDPIAIGKIDAAHEATPLNLTQGEKFIDALGDGLNSINADLSQADSLARQMAAGDKVPVHDVMIAFEQAHLKLQMAVEVRNRVVDAYQNLTNMQL